MLKTASKSQRTRSIIAMFLLFTSAAVIEAKNLTALSALSNSDVWLHLRSGLWILQNHAVPHTGLFSQSPAAPWIAVSWLYDLKLAIWYNLFGLRSIPMFLMSFRAALAVLTFLLAGGRRNFWAAVAVSAIAQYILAAVPPSPTYVSVLLFSLESLLLLASRRSGSLRTLLWLPPLFLVWANLDIHFVYGLGLFLLFLASLAPEKFKPSGAAHPPQSTKLAAIAALSFLATLITPYFYRPYQVFFSTVFSPANSVLPDYLAPGFRQPQDYILLLFAMSAFLALGLRRSGDLFLIVFLALGAGLSFHSQRDVWLVTLAAVAVVGDAVPTSAATEPVAGTPLRDLLIAAALALVVLATVVVFRLPRSSQALLAKASQSYPVAASNYIRDHHLPQPLFNALEWGGFLTWYLPDYPVAIDGRTDLYGDDFILQYSKMMNAELRYTDFPAIANARTILLPHSAIMAQALSRVSAFTVAYSDDVATVLTRNTDVE